MEKHIDETQHKRWAGTTYGNGWMHRHLIDMLRYIDMRVLYAFAAIFIVPVCLVVNPAQKITYRYFLRQWRMPWWKAALKTYHNFYLFSQVVIDKFAMYAGKKFQVEIDGYDHFLSLEALPEAFVQLSSHIGNYEIAGYTLKVEHKVMNALVFAGEKSTVMQNRDKLFQETNIRMIPVYTEHSRSGGDMGYLFEIDGAIQRGEIVSMPADRIFGSQKSVEHDFIGGRAKFPQGPFSVATLRGCNVLAINVMKVASKKYRIYVTPLEYDKTAKRKEQIEQLSQAYVKELERVVTMYPEQWYNYYEFWG